MIKADFKTVRLEGQGVVLCVELEKIIRSFLEVTSKHLTEEGAYELLDGIIENAKKPEEEVIAESRKIAEENKELFEAFSKSIGKEIRKEIKKSEEAEEAEETLRDLINKVARAIRGEETNE